MTDFEFELPDIIQVYTGLVQMDGDVDVSIDGQTVRIDGHGNMGTAIIKEIIRLGYVCLASAASNDKYEDPMQAFDVITQNAKILIEHNTEEVKEDGVCGQTT